MKKKKKLPPTLWALDTEDDSKGHCELINLFNGQEHHSFWDIKSAIEFMGTLENSEVWCTNLGYDLSNIFFNHPQFLRVTYAGSRVIAATLSTDQVFFRDTLNHWKISVEKMGERIGLKKLESTLFNQKRKPTKKQLLTRCQRDTEITYHFVKTMREKYHSIGAKLKPTIGSTALDYFYTKNPQIRRDYKNQFKTKELEFMREGMFGGRTEAFFNKPIKGPIWVYDFNSLYPSVMRDNPFPYLHKRRFTKKPNLKNEGIIHARFRVSNCDIPFIPYRHDSGLYFPVGDFDTHCTYVEAREAIKAGAKILKVHRALEFFGGTYYPFRDLMDFLYDQRDIAKKQKDDLLSETFKLLMNNLFGKFSQSNEKTELVPLTKEYLKNNSCQVLDSKWVLKNELGDYPAHTNYIWSAYVTAYGRIKLWKKIEETKALGGVPLYCDTDSIFVKSKRDLFGNNTKLGELKLENKLKSAYFKGLKLYRIEDQEGKRLYKAKGVPKSMAEEFFELEKVKYRKPTRLREVLRRNSGKKKPGLRPNVWLEVEKVHKKKYSKRVVMRDGTTRAIEIRK